MIRVENLSLRAGQFALEGISFEVPTGCHAVLMGRTGAGKTTLLESLCGLRQVTGGRIWLMDREVTNLKPSERGIGFVPQDAGQLFRNADGSRTSWIHSRPALQTGQLIDAIA